jgi:metal-responsive CopG/Arc/MetJ family transcriptional regulator
MLGIRLNGEVEARFERFVRRRGQRKSEVGRTAIIEYMDRHEDDQEFERQLKAAAEMERNQLPIRLEIEELDEAAWRMTNDLA